METSDRRVRGLSLLLVGVVFAFSLACNGSDDGGSGGFSGTYYVAIATDPTYMIVIDEADGAVTFTMSGPDLATAGTGTVTDSTMALSAPLGSDNIIMDTTLSDDGQSFSGTFEVTFGDEFLVGTITGTKTARETYDIDADGIPRFAGANYIALDKIGRISKFRSGEGHDDSDSFESCRNMKHYFDPESEDPSTVGIFSPVDGTIIGTIEEGGTSFGISPDENGAFYFVIFHVDLAAPLNPGDVVTAGQQLGTHSEAVQASDILVGVHTPDGLKLVSYFDVMTDSLFASYQARGMNSRSDAIISKEERDADPLACDDSEFADSGNLEGWVTLD